MNLSYEQQFQVLETKIESLSRGDLPLEQAFTEYEQALALLKDCQQYLDLLENKLETIVPSEMSDQISLEELLEKLEISVQIFEHTETLEEIVDYYAVGMDLIHQSQLLLEKYEQDVFQLSKEQDLITENAVKRNPQMHNTGNNNV